MPKGRRRKQLRISDCWLYAINSPKDLAHRLSTEKSPVSAETLQSLSSDTGNYKLFKLSSGRAVQEPVRLLQKLHARINKLLSRVETPEYLHSAVRGRSYLTNARSHGANVPAVKIDVKKFFQSVPRVAIFNFFFDTMKCRRDVAGLLADFLTYGGHLPTGSSASPIISYYAFKRMFDDLHSLALTRELIMTCYVDDISFSGFRADNGLLIEARKIIAKTGLKSHKLRTFSADQPRVITGVCNVPAGERVPNKLHLKISTGFEQLANAKTDAERLKTLRPLLGRLDAASQINPVFGARAKTLRAQMKQLLHPST